MVSPINYSIDVQSPFQAALQGYQAGAAIRDDQQKQALFKQQQAASQQSAQQQAEIIRNLINNPNAGAQDYANAIVQVPGLKDQLEGAWKLRDKDQTQSQISFLSQVGAAIDSGNPKIGADLMRSKADAMEASNGGPSRDSQALRTQADVVDQHPEFAGAMVRSLLAAHPEGQKALESLLAQRTGAADARKKNAEATTAEVEAGMAPQTAAVKLENQREDAQTKRAQREIARLDVEIKQANTETERGRLQLEREKWQAEIGKKGQAASDDVQNQLDNTRQALDTVNTVMNHPGLESGTGTGGSFRAWFASSDAADFRAQVDTLKSQQFLVAAQNLKGMGALSDAEGARLERAVANLDPSKQSTQSFKNALGVIKTTLERAQAKAIASGKLPTSGGAFVMQVPKFGVVDEGRINAALKANPGATREQVIQYLNSLGGK